ncbi:hypothetical protein HKCCE2091_15195 [Rhodobacterales bacterium HKCCE2091]|nr:hypothetical protein [Rhodobacterales bacterium HKCCE2091]
MTKPYSRTVVGVSNVKRCSACGGFIADDVDLCKHCGADQADRRCTSCYSRILPEALRCRHCGAEQSRWRRYMTVSIPVLGLVIAALTIFSAQISAALQLAVPITRVEVDHAYVENVSLSVYAVNTGNRRVVVQQSMPCTAEVADKAIRVEFRRQSELTLQTGRSEFVTFGQNISFALASDTISRRGSLTDLWTWVTTDFLKAGEENAVRNNVQLHCAFGFRIPSNDVGESEEAETIILDFSGPTAVRLGTPEQLNPGSSGSP